jgi:hypothetical protein
MKRLLTMTAILSLLACNNSKKESPSSENNQSTITTINSNTAVPANNNKTMERTSGTKISIEGKEINLGGSLLVQKDKKKLQPGADYMCILTASGNQDVQSLSLNFLLDLKPGSYPVVGMGLHRNPDGQAELYGGLMGGEEKLTGYKVNITECKDLGSNNLGGHKWSISGTFDDLVIPAMGLMLMDKTKNHPKEIKVEKGSFFNLTFDDNWDEMMNGMKDKFNQLNKNK